MNKIIQGVPTKERWADGVDHTDIEKRVTVFIQGKHGRIGLVVPENKPTEKEWHDLHQSIAEIVTNSIINTSKMKEDS
ncbi:hypothetical protein [Paenibacillus sp. RC84]|uniref:hypothetical protein n=1 Tax=Paenibacillus sp. RC84 TaxID=3156252 RepID=UPI00351625D2